VKDNGYNQCPADTTDLGQLSHNSLKLLNILWEEMASYMNSAMSIGGIPAL
jgi:hypothetical protein